MKATEKTKTSLVRLSKKFNAIGLKKQADHLIESCNSSEKNAHTVLDAFTDLYNYMAK